MPYLQLPLVLDFFASQDRATYLFNPELLVFGGFKTGWGCSDERSQKDDVSNEKRAPVCLEYVGDYTTQLLWGL